MSEIEAKHLTSDTGGPAVTLPSRRYAWTVLAVLVVAMLFSYCDRYLLSVMVEHLRRDFHLTDTQIGVLQGLPFAVVFAVAGVPMGWLSDRYNRFMVLGAAVVLWSLATAASTFATSYTELLVLRLGVALGEAALAPVAYTLISDCFSRERAAIPTACFAAAGSVGGGVAFMVGGAAVSALAPYPRLELLPWLEPVFGWQATFLIIGGPGVFLGLLLFLFKDPIRQRSREVVAARITPRTPKPAASAHFKTHWRAFLTVYISVSLLFVVQMGVNAWGVALLDRTFNWEPGRAGLTFGIVTTGALITGFAVMGAICNYWDRRKSLTARMTLSAIAATLMLPFSIYPLMPTPYASLSMLAVFIFFAGLAMGVAALAVQQICPPPFRGQAIAVYAIFFNLIGTGLGPLSVAVLTDRLFGDPGMLRYSLALAPAIVLPITVLIIWSGRKAYGRAAQATLDWEAQYAPALVARIPPSRAPGAGGGR